MIISSRSTYYTGQNEGATKKEIDEIINSNGDLIEIIGMINDSDEWLNCIRAAVYRSDKVAQNDMLMLLENAAREYLDPDNR
jgi:hypothetical protein